MPRAPVRFAPVVLAGLLLAGCLHSSGEPEVVVYTALDSVFSEPILQQFSATQGVRVLPKYDTESTKTVGLAQAIIAEANRPRCDVFWNNEILHTLRLEQQGLLDVYRPPAADTFPEMYRSSDGTWHGFGARARVLIVNTNRVPADTMPASIYDLCDERWRGEVGLAKPLFGTTATHAACLFAALGDEAARGYFRALKANEVQVLSGNKQVARSVAAGRLAFGMTDTDDAIIELESGFPVTIVYPDREPDELGTLFIPNTLAVIRGCPHPETARRLVDFLLTPDVERQLAAGPSAQIPLNSEVEVETRVETPRTVKAMQVDFAEAARLWKTASEFIRSEFTGGN